MSKRKGSPQVPSASSSPSTSKGAGGGGASVNENILRNVHDVYTDPDKGLIKIAGGVGMKLLPPRRKVSIMIIGNHSSGKSSFINWYIGEDALSTGVAIETQGFTFVTSGKRRDTLKGGPTLELFEQFRTLARFDGVEDTLTTEISTSQARKFPMLLLIDTPGLVDGNMVYPFDVDEAIYELGNKVDVIFVFFDPIGQALCSRTMRLVKGLSQSHPQKLFYYVTKMDHVESESDRQKVLIQITQNLSAHIQHRTALTLPTIFIPRPDNAKMNITNGIEDLCQQIEKTIEQTVQNTLTRLKSDCDTIAAAIDAKIAANVSLRSSNWKATGRGLMYSLGALFSFALFVAYFLAEFSVLTKDGHAAGSTAEWVAHFIGLSGMAFLADVVPTDYARYVMGFLGLVTLLLALFSKLAWKTKTVLSSAEITNLIRQKEYITSHVISYRDELFKEYTLQSVSQADF